MDSSYCLNSEKFYGSGENPSGTISLFQEPAKTRESFREVTVAGILLLFFLWGCGSSEPANNPDITLTDTTDNQTNIPQQTANTGQQNLVKSGEISEKIILTFDKGNSKVKVPLDPDRQDFILRLSGDEFKKQQQKAAKLDSIRNALKKQIDQRVDSLVQARLNRKINKVMQNFRRAQDLFYRNDYESAMKYVNRTLDIAVTAEAMGLKGTIFFMQDNMEAARYWWNRAVKMDPNIPIPDIPDLRKLIDTSSRQIKKGSRDTTKKTIPQDTVSTLNTTIKQDTVSNQ